MANQYFGSRVRTVSDELDESPVHSDHVKYDVTLVEDARVRYWCVTCGHLFFGPFFALEE